MSLGKGLDVIQAGLVFSASMAWADVVNTSVKKIYPDDSDKAIRAKVIYAAIVTILVIIIFSIITFGIEVVNEQEQKQLKREHMILRFAS